MTARSRRWAAPTVLLAAIASTSEARADDESTRLEALLEENVVTTVSKAAQSSTVAPATQYLGRRPTSRAYVDLSGGLANIPVELAPVDPFRATVGLQYDFLP